MTSEQMKLNAERAIAYADSVLYEYEMVQGMGGIEDAVLEAFRQRAVVAEIIIGVLQTEEERDD